MKTILVLMDTLNRHMLNMYNDRSPIKTPNMQRLAEKSIVFDNHWVGSAPCMPARRDIMTGRFNFLERNWGPIEPFDVTLPEKLRENGVFCHITTDHYHYFEIGGENYCQLFNTWDLKRGQESDPWVSKVNAPKVCEEYYGRLRPQYELNRTKFISEEDFASPKTFASACEWLENNKDADNYFLMVEAFDPHEPFDCPKEYLELYGDKYDGPRYNWPEYSTVTEPGEAIEHLRKQYAGTVTMADKWFGKMLDIFDKYNMWEDTLMLFVTDHGHLLGEHGFTGKNFMHMYNELSHIPFIVHLPGDKRAGERISALTQSVDIMPTLLDYYGIDIPSCVQGHSLKGILEGTVDKVRDEVLYGTYGMGVNIFDGRYTYLRAPENDDNYPCNIYTAMPTSFRKYLGRGKEDEIECGRFLKHTNYPVYKIPISYKDKKSKKIEYVRETLLYDINEDYAQQNPIKDKEIEKEMEKKLIRKMKELGSPSDQFERLGL